MLGGYANRVAWVDLTAGKVQYKEINEDDARDEVVRVDEARQAFVRNSFGAEWLDPALYDLVMNVEALEDEVVADLIVTNLARIAAIRWPGANVGRSGEGEGSETGEG